MRVHELAKELGISSKDCMVRLRALGVEVKNHMSAVDTDTVELLKRESPSGALPEAAAKTPPPAPEARPPAPAEPKPPPEKIPPPPAAPPPAVHAAPVVPAAAQPEAKAPAAPKAKGDIVVDGKTIRVRGAVVVKELAMALNIRPNQLITDLMGMNVLASITQRVEINVARKVAEKHGFEFEHEKRTAEYKPAQKKGLVEAEEGEDQAEDLMPRAPVVTFLGHVDHGKTSLLDKIRNTAVVDGEHGGITQHIGAYTVEAGGRQITFLDTPGHAAFTAMRARGANLTDIAVIVIAADDGIMPQTREAIMHAKAADVALIVALNKMDLPAANEDRVKQQLQAEQLAPEDWGGETICCSVSAQTGDGIDHLLEMILLQADVLELQASPKRRASGFVIEAQLEPGRGPTANLLITRGTLRIGDAMICGPHWGKVRALINDHGVKVKSAGPSTPVKCLGLSGVPEAGAEFRVITNEKAAKVTAQSRSDDLKQEQLAAPKKASLEALLQQIEDDQKIELRVILKADTQGSIEAIANSLQEIESNKISLKILLAATGNVTVNDVMLASASDAVILGFHVAKEPGVDQACRREGTEVRLYHVIYELLDRVREAMTGLLLPEIRETVVAQAEVKQVFSLGKTTNVAGCIMTKGTASPKHRVRVKRGDEVLYEGSITSIKHFQDVASEIREGQECGIRLDNFSSFEPGDILEFYQLDEVKQTL